MRPAVTYTPCDTYSREQTGDIITFAQFEEGNILTKTRNYAISGEKSDEKSIMPPLLSEEETDAMDSVDESYDDIISMEMLEEICDKSQYHPKFNQREARYKIRDRIRQIQS